MFLPTLDNCREQNFKISQASHKKTNTVFHLYQILRVIKIIGMENRMMVARGLEVEGNGELLFNVIKFQLFKMKGVMEIHGGDNCITL